MVINMGISIELNNIKEKAYKAGIDIGYSSLDDIIYNFEDSLDKQYKKDHGIVYTPQWVSDAMAWRTINTYLKKKTGHTWDETINHFNSDTAVILKMLWDEALKIRICDPCIGAGVFIFSIIKAYLKMHESIIALDTTSEKSELKLILGLLKNNIYGVEIDSLSVDVTIFRLWAYCIKLGYALDLDTFSKMLNIKVGDALNHKFNGMNIEYSYGLKEINECLRDEYIEEWQNTWDKIRNAKTDREIYVNKAKLFNLALEISSALKGTHLEYKCDARMIKNKTQFKTFNWLLEFESIFNDNLNNPGFDIIIGNPPYVRNSNTEDIESDTLGSTANLYMYFLELANTRGTKDCITSMIVPNNWFSAAYAKEFRIKYTSKIESIIDFNMHYVFKTAFIATAIVTLDKSKKTHYLKYSNVEFIMEEQKEDRLLQEAEEKCIDINIDSLDIERKYIFGEQKLYDILNRLKSLPTLIEQYHCKIERGLVVDPKDRCEPSLDTRFLAKGEDTLTFGILTETKLATRLPIQKDYKNYLMIPEVTRSIRCCRLGNVIPLDSTIYIENTHRNLIGLFNSEIFNLIYSILISTNFMISYAEVRFPRKNKSMEEIPVPKSLDLLDDLRIKTDDWVNVNQNDKIELNRIIKQLYGLTDEEVEILRKYNI